MGSILPKCWARGSILPNEARGEVYYQMRGWGKYTVYYQMRG